MAPCTRRVHTYIQLYSHLFTVGVVSRKVQTAKIRLPGSNKEEPMKPHNGEKECRPWNDCIVATLPLACKKNVGDAHAAVRRCCWKRSNSIHDSIMPYDIKKSTAKPLRVLVVPAPAGPGQPAIERGAQSRQVALAGGAASSKAGKRHGSRSRTQRSAVGQK